MGCECMLVSPISVLAVVTEIYLESQEAVRHAVFQFILVGVCREDN